MNKSFLKFITDFGPLLIFFTIYYKSGNNLTVAIPPLIIATLIAVVIMYLAENDEITYEAYVSEQNLLMDDSDEPIKHPLIEEIFSGKKGSSYFKMSN